MTALRGETACVRYAHHAIYRNDGYAAVFTAVGDEDFFKHGNFLFLPVRPELVEGLHC